MTWEHISEKMQDLWKDIQVKLNCEVNLQENNPIMIVEELRKI
jgi:hypothetical protein